MKNNTRLILISIILLLVLIPGVVQGESPKSLMVFPGNIQSLEWNPALLAVSPYRFQLHMDVVDFNLWTNAWTVNDIIKYISADFWDEDMKKEMIRKVSGDAMTTGLDLRSGLYTGFGSWGLASRAKGNAALGVDKDFLVLLLEGITMEEMEEGIDFSDCFVRGNVIIDNSLSYAFPLDVAAESLDWESFHIGAGLHYIYGLGWAHLNLEKGDVKLNFEEDDFSVEGAIKGEAFYSVTGLEGGGGHGFALDIGAWGQINPQLGVGLSVTNLGMIRWSGVKKAVFELDDVKIELPNFLKGEDFDFDEEDFDFDPDELEFKDHDPVNRATPIGVQAGVHYEVLPRIHLAGSLGYNQNPLPHLGVSLGSRFFYPRWLPFTLTLDYETHKGTPSLSTSLGLHIGPWEAINLTISDIKLIGGWGKETSILLNTSIRF